MAVKESTFATYAPIFGMARLPCSRLLGTLISFDIPLEQGSMAMLKDLPI